MEDCAAMTKLAQVRLPVGAKIEEEPYTVARPTTLMPYYVFTSLEQRFFQHREDAIARFTLDKMKGLRVRLLRAIPMSNMWEELMRHGYE